MPTAAASSAGHAAADGAGRLLRLIVTPEHWGDAPQARCSWQGLRARHVIADAAYNSDAIRRQILGLSGRACIKPNPTRKRLKQYDRRRLTAGTHSEMTQAGHS